MNPREFPLIQVSGSASEMGRQHGEQARTRIGQYISAIEVMTGLDRNELGRRALWFLPMLEQFSPAYTEEIRGLAEGAHIPLGQAMLCQVRLEAMRVTEGCSAFALTGAATENGQPLAGQNQDLEPEFESLGIVLQVRPDDGRPPAVFFTFAGQLGYAGMNGHGVAHFANKLYGDPWRPGLPFYPLRRAFLEQRSVAHCLDLARKTRTCAAANFVFCDGSGAIGDVEIRPEAAIEFQGTHPDALLHTNHYLVDRFKPYETMDMPDSPCRLDRLTTVIMGSWGQWNVDRLKSALADHEGSPAAICRHGAGGTHSIAGYIAEPARSLLHVRRGHGCTGHWTAYRV